METRENWLLNFHMRLLALDMPVYLSNQIIETKPCDLSDPSLLNNADHIQTIQEWYTD